jgi:hypothetical protein
MATAYLSMISSGGGVLTSILIFSLRRSLLLFFYFWSLKVVVLLHPPIYFLFWKQNLLAFQVDTISRWHLFVWTVDVRKFPARIRPSFPRLKKIFYHSKLPSYSWTIVVDQDYFSAMDSLFVFPDRFIEFSKRSKVFSFQLWPKMLEYISACIWALLVTSEMFPKFGSLISTSSTFGGGGRGVIRRTINAKVCWGFVRVRYRWIHR